MQIFPATNVWHRLIARLTGERQEKPAARKGDASFSELLAIATRASRAVQRPYVEHGELLYDERGLPK